MKDNGEIVGHNGYEPTSRQWVDLPDDLGPISVPEEPTSRDVSGAVEFLCTEVLGDFLWSDRRASLANAIGFVMTPVLRSIFVGPSPLFAVMANQQGSGKSLLSQVCALIATGSETSTSPYPGDDQEFRKLATSLLRTSPAVVILDNVSKPVRSAQLARLVTSETWNDRVLGQSFSVHIPNRVTWSLNGNAIVFGGDLQRRVVPIELSSDRPDPWNRAPSSFRHPRLKLWVHEHRAEILSAIFTCARSWMNAGRPEPKASLGGGFESWASTIGGIIEHVGIRGHLTNLDRAIARDWDADDWGSLLAHLVNRGFHKGDDFTTHSLIETANGGDLLLRDLIDEVSPAMTPKAFGMAIAGRDGRWHDISTDTITRYAAFVSSGKAHGNRRRWRLVVNEVTDRRVGDAPT